MVLKDCSLRSAQYTDAETGFQYLRARYYDPATGQFLTRDPIEAQTREAYGYVGGNPLNETDPTGLCWGPTCWVEEAILVGREIIDEPGAAFSDGAKGAANFGVGFANAALGTSFDGYCGPGLDWSKKIGSATFFAESALGAAAGFRGGREISVGSKGTRIAPWGNRTGHPTGRYPHYHRRQLDSAGNVVSGQGIKRHRPWDTKGGDRSFWDRF